MTDTKETFRVEANPDSFRLVQKDGGMDGQDILVKLPKTLLKELDEIWPKTGSGSRSDFIRTAIFEEMLRTKTKLATCNKPEVIA